MTATSATAQQIQITTGTANFFNPIKGTRFFPIPAAVASKPDLTTNSKIVYGYLASCFGRDGLVHPKLETISREVGLSSKQQAGRCVSELKVAGLIAVIRTGRASYYRFLDPGAGDNAQLDQPQTDSESMQAESRIIDSLTQKPVTPIIENKSKKKTTTKPRVVVSLGNESDIKTCLDAIPKANQTPSTEKIIKISLTSHSLDAVMQAIQYTNYRSTKNYSAYLNLTLKKDWAADWTPPEAITVRQTADIMQAETDIKAEVKKAEESAILRAEVAKKWLALPGAERQKIRDEHLQSCNKFQAKRAKRLSDDRLVGTIGFKMFLERRFNEQ